LYADSAGHAAAGPLFDIETGQPTQVLLTASQVGVNFGGNGTNAASGTDAYRVFNGFVDLAAGDLRSIEIEAGDAYQYTFENLDPGATYEFAGTAVRGNAAYTDRWTLVEIQGADSFRAAHSTGSGVVTAGLAGNQVAIWTGGNAAAGQGYIAQWLDIDPGSDGIFHVVSTHYQGSVPTQVHPTGRADGNKGYGLAAIRLIENVAAGPPAVENVAASDVRAFEATVGGRITSTGGQVPTVKVYFGTTDGGSNAPAWQNVVNIGQASRDFSTVLDGLAQNTTYYFRSFGENTLGGAWAASSSSFRTLSANKPTVQNAPATSVGAFAAILGGNITDTGNDPPLVTLYYGSNDGGTNAAAWDGSVELGVQSGLFSVPISGLQPLTRYYFTAFAQNSLGGSWATPSLSFTTIETPPLQVNEFMADNSAALKTRVRDDIGRAFAGDSLTPDWIELHNPTGQMANLGGYFLTDDLDRPRQWQIPAGTLIPAAGYLVFFASGLDIRDARQDERGYLHTNFELNGAGGGDIALLDASGNVVSAIRNTPPQSEDVSYGVDTAGVERFFPVPTPGSDNAHDTPAAPEIKTRSTTFTDSIIVEIIPALPTHTIRYTLDERVPTSASTIYTGPLTISATTQLRAISIGANGKSSIVVGETYIKLGANVLDDSSNLPLVIVETFGDAVPGVGTTFGDMFVAMIEPGSDGRSQLTDSFDVGTRGGMHVRGSSSAGFSKKQYRVEFWDQRNEDQQHAVLGLPAESDWIFYGPGPYDRVLISNPLMFDLSNQIGRYATRTRWVEMYLNSNGGELNSSDYAGVYAIIEVIERGDDRVDVEPLATGAGGVPVQGGFVWKNDRGSSYVDPETTTSAQRQYIDGWINGLRAAAAGPNFKDPNLGYQRYADVGSFIDHNLLNLLAMNVDALRLSSYYYKTANGKLEAGPIWDFDRSLESTDGRDDNPRTWFGGGDSTRYFDDSDRVMSWWPDMFQDPDFVQQYIDRWFELRRSEFSLDNLNALIDAHAAQLAEAAPRDYARWSGSRFSNFAGEIRHLKDWLRRRVEWIDSQWLAAPSFDTPTPRVPAGTPVSLSAATGSVYYTLDGSDPRGEDGAIRPEARLATGPIQINGFTRITARVYKQGHGRTTNGYIPTGDDWSAPIVGVYYNDSPAAFGNVAISEVHFHPGEPNAAERAAGYTDADDFEFIELTNTSTSNVVLTGAKLALADVGGEMEGVTFDFTTSSLEILPPGARVLVVENRAAFEFRYGNGLPIAGVWNGALDNSGETLTLLAYNDAAIQQFSYNDGDTWPSRADGDGSSLELINPNANYNDPDNWRGSVDFGGSPGRAGSEPIGIVINEILAHTDPPATPSDSIELFNSSNRPIDIGGWYLSDSSADFLKYQIPSGTILPAGGYIVFDEADFNPTPATPGPKDFALNSAHGDDVWLIIGNGNGGVARFVDDVHFPATPNGESMGRIPNATGRLAPLSRRTLGAENGAPRIGPVVVSELHYNPGTPSPSARAIDPTLTPDDLEYVEIHNPALQPVDLTEWRIRGGVDFDFTPGTSLAGGRTLLVVSFDPNKTENANRLAAFRTHYGINASVPLVGGYAGHLDDLGEPVILQRPDEPPVDEPAFIPRLLEDEVVYDAAAPWPAANGTGQSLTRVSTASFGNLASSWTAAAPTPGASQPAGDVNNDGQINSTDVDLVCGAIQSGDPRFDLNSDGLADESDVDFLVRSILRTTAGDANTDGRFNSTDLVQVFQTGEYEDAAEGNSLWSEGDWNCDGDFDSGDLVVAFQAGSYSAASFPSLKKIGPPMARYGHRF
jgi:hypothetical protein